MTAPSSSKDIEHEKNAINCRRCPGGSFDGSFHRRRGAARRSRPGHDQVGIRKTHGIGELLSKGYQIFVPPVFVKLMELANRHDLKALHEMFWQSPSVLLVAKSAIPTRSEE